MNTISGERMGDFRGEQLSASKETSGKWTQGRKWKVGRERAKRRKWDCALFRRHDCCKKRKPDRLNPICYKGDIFRAGGREGGLSTIRRGKA